MLSDITRLVKNIHQIDTRDICSAWEWLIPEQMEVILVSCVGDMFLQSADGEINWLDTSMGELSIVADSMEDFHRKLADPHYIDNWFMPSLVDELIAEGKTLAADQVYSYKIPPILNGEFTAANMNVVSASVHFSMTGQIIKQIWDAPGGTEIEEINIL